MQAHQAHRDGRHGSCASVTRPARSAARCSASQACLAAGDSAANRRAAKAGRAAGLRQQLAVQRRQVAGLDGRREPDRARDDRELGLARRGGGCPVGAAQDDVARQLQPEALRQVAANWALVAPGCPGSGSGRMNSDAPETVRGDVMPLPGSCW